jgi:peptide/nickel transport system substrate-binding protein
MKDEIMWVIWSRSVRQRFPALAALLVSLVVVASSVADEAGDTTLLDGPPFDQVILDDANQGAVLNVAPLDLPNRQVPSPFPDGSLRFAILGDSSGDYEVPWKDVAQIRLYEQMLLDEARRLTSAGQFDEAFDYYARLLSKYKTFPGLDQAVNEFLRNNALALYQKEQYDRALAVLESLYERDPTNPGLANAVESVANKLIEREVRSQDYAAARDVLELWQSHFSKFGSQSAEQWERRFQDAAQRSFAEAQRLDQQQQYVAARRAILKALAIWPQLPAARDLLAEIEQQNPSVVVGVTELSPEQPVRRLDSWAAMRTSRLVQPTLAELVGFNAEGGVYRSPFGKLLSDESGKHLSLQFEPAKQDAGTENPLAADLLARYFLAIANPGSPLFSQAFADSFAGVSVSGDGFAQIDWSQPHVRPEALLQVPLPPPAIAGAAAQESPSPLSHWKRSDYSDVRRSLFELTTAGKGGPTGQVRTIIEQSFPDDEAAVRALLDGEVDVLDRVPPWQVARLRKTKGIQVDTYRLPTVHVLIPNTSRPLLASREFRRALCYGIDRQQIVQQVLLAGETMPGFEVISGPFPTGLSQSDPVRYAYNSQVLPRPYEPRLASILATIAWYSVLDPAHEGNVELTDIPQLVLAHPADPVARVACQTIQLQLERIGIPIKLLEFSAEDLLAGRVECDLRYAEIAMWEPVVDAAWLLGPDGLDMGRGSDYLEAALHRLNKATNWKDVRSQLAEIHEFAFHDLPVIPLWQTVDYFAYRSTVTGIGQHPVSLYQEIDRWNVDHDSDTNNMASGK